MSVITCVKKPGAKIPKYQTAGASGADVYACIEHEIIIASGERKLIPTGLFFAIPKGFEIQIRPRSGLALKHGVTVLNSPGTIDSDYRGEILILLINLGEKPFKVKNGDRIAQMIVGKSYHLDFKVVDSLDATERGFGGYGSTGL